MIDKTSFSSFLHKNVYCGCSLESLWRGYSNEHPQHRFYEEITKIISELSSNIINVLSVFLDYCKKHLGRLICIGIDINIGSHLYCKS